MHLWRLVCCQSCFVLAVLAFHASRLPTTAFTCYAEPFECSLHNSSLCFQCGFVLGDFVFYASNLLTKTLTLGVVVARFCLLSCLFPSCLASNLALLALR